MKRLLFTFAMIFGWSLATLAEAPTPIATLHAAAALTNAEADQHQPVAIKATVTYFDVRTGNLDIQMNDEAIYVRSTAKVKLVPGDRILVKGTMQPSFLPYIISDNITLLHHGVRPEPLPASFDDLVGKKINCRLVTVRGLVRAANLVSSPTAPSGRLVLLMEGGYINIEVDDNGASALKSLLDEEVEITGAAGRIFDGKMQQFGAKVKVSSFADIKVVGRAGADPWSLPVTPLGDIVTGFHVRDLSRRLRVHGTITYYQPGSAVVLQNNGSSLWVSTNTSEPLRIGDVADATGIPDIHDRRLILEYAEVRDSQIAAPVNPVAATWSQLAFWGRSTLGGHQFDLVSIDGRVVTVAREAVQDEFVMVANGREFTAIFRHPPPPSPLPQMPQVPLGATIRVTGICVPQTTEPFNDEAPFDILMRSFDDIEVVARPSLLTVGNMMIVTLLLLLAVMVAGIRSWSLERRVRRQTATVAYIERRRRRILEDINGSSRPLAEIIEEITEVVSFRLQGAPCWCQIADGARLGNMPPDLGTLRVLQDEIHSRSGAPFGTIFAAFDRLAKPAAEQAEALSMGAGLATLAIGTRRLYSELVHRSEFDLLTEIQNRFSMEKQLDLLIEEARRTAGIFGLIYIDLDDFKQVNDRYGHHVGDLYLQETAARLKRQLRPGDILARLGGDEFAVLVPVVRTRTDVQEIALRLEHCFDQPFAIQTFRLPGAASVGFALYPEEASTRDALLRAADAKMYKVKHSRKSLKKKKAGQFEGELVPEGR